MRDIGAVLKAEVTRLSNRAMRSEVNPLRKEATALKREVSHLRRTVETLEKHVAEFVLEAQERREDRLKAIAEQEVQKARITGVAKGQVPAIDDTPDVGRTHSNAANRATSPP